MKTKIIEVTNNQLNWGKFMLCRFEDEEWATRSQIGSGLLLPQIGWSMDHIWVFDLQTFEGAAFLPRGIAEYDLRKHQIWVCPMFEPFLEWLYMQDLSNLEKLPSVLNLKDAEFMMSGHRRPGPDDEERKRVALHKAPPKTGDRGRGRVSNVGRRSKSG